MVYIYVKFESIIIKICPTMGLNANMHLPLKQEMLKVKVKDKGRNGYIAHHGISSIVFSQ